MLVLASGRVFAQAGPSLEVHGQHLADGVLVIDAVVISEPGWVDIHREAEVQGNPGAVIGYAHIDPGETNYLSVKIDPDLVSAILYAVLHTDRGQPGVFEFPGPDEAILVNGAALTRPTARPRSARPALH
jgi:hypothetical protein